MNVAEGISGTISLWYKNRSGDGFGVYYRVNGGSWNELFYTGAGHDNWTELSVDLTGFADNYQLGFRQRDYYKWGVDLDEISVNILIPSLCANGELTNVVASTGSYTWTCAGQNGGSDASCSAERTCAAMTYMGYDLPKADFGVTTDLLSKHETINGGTRDCESRFICSAGTFTKTGAESCSTTCDEGYTVLNGNLPTSSCVIHGSCGPANGESYIFLPTDLSTITEGFESGIPAGWTQEGTHS